MAGMEIHSITIGVVFLLLPEVLLWCKSFFLDELPEFSRNVLEVLRQPLEDRCINVSRAKYSISYPCNFMFVAAMNPCPCGYYNHPTKDCVCTPGQITRYLNKISGPLLDRIDYQRTQSYCHNFCAAS